MDDRVITFNKISKKYRIKKELFKYDEFWALRNVSFEVKKGSSLGIIGVNGAGKTTILKILAGVVTPTSGVAKVRGSIGTLIDLSAGFNQELSGRENISLQGAVIGLSRRDVAKNLDKIIDFSELEEFIDEPIKHYSMGMLMKLGFSIAVHLNPEILLIDEVLAVGDINYRRKCIDKMQEFITQKKTFVVVSHDLSMIRSLCENVIYLDSGNIKESGDPGRVISSYIKDSYKSFSTGKDQQLIGSMDPSGVVRSGTGEVRISGVKLIGKNGNEIKSVEMGEDITLDISYIIFKKIEGPISFVMHIMDMDNRYIAGAFTDIDASSMSVDSERSIRCVIKSPPLLPTLYRINLAVLNPRHSALDGWTTAGFDRLERALDFEMVSTTTPSEYMLSSGVLRLDYTWQIIK